MFSAFTFILAVYFYRWSDEWPLAEQPAIGTIEGAVNHPNLFPYLFYFTCAVVLFSLLSTHRWGEWSVCSNFVFIHSKVGWHSSWSLVRRSPGGGSGLMFRSGHYTLFFCGSICGHKWRKPDSGPSIVSRLLGLSVFESTLWWYCNRIAFEIEWHTVKLR